MILLQATQENAPVWRTHLQDGNQIAQIIGTVMVVIYVIYTYKTFKQIKKQTDYQQDAYLKVENSIVKEINDQDPSIVTIIDNRIVQSKNSLTTKYLRKDIPQKMMEVLKPIFKFDDNLFEGNLFTVNLTNYGNAEVNLINLNVCLLVINSKEVAERKMLRERDTHNFKVKIEEIIGRNGGKIKIPIISTASFPTYTITITGEYYDVRNKKYHIHESVTSGQNEHFLKLP
ncbi:MAG: hypothetical protein RJA76_288 [Bacteroidota bacterium]|jgi:hypothetical protein